MLNDVVFGLPKNVLNLLPGAQSANGINMRVTANGLATLDGTATADTTITIPASTATLGTGQYTASMTAKSGYATYATGAVAAKVMQTAQAAQVIANGNFANGTTGWGVDAGALSVSSNVLTATGNGNTTYINPSSQFMVQAGHNYFLCVCARVNDATNLQSASVNLQQMSGDWAQIGFPIAITTQSQRFFGFSAPNFSGQARLQIVVLYSSSANQSGKQVMIDGSGQNGALCIDMGTDASNPLYNLTADQMAALFPSYFYPTENVALPTPFASVSSGSPATFTPQSGQTVPSVQLSIPSGAALSQYTFGLQVEPGSTATGWVPPGTQGVIFYPAVGETGSITNSGNVDAYPVITITGACANPSVTNNTTGETIAVNVALGSADTLIIDCRPATRGCYLNGTLAFGIKQGLGWMHCPPGDNVMTFNRNGYDTKRHCTISLQGRYL